MKRVQNGDEVSLSANAYNAWCDAAEDLQSRRMSQTGVARPERRVPDVVLVRNDSGADVDRYGILGIDGPIITPTDNLDEFKNRVTLKGVLPTSAHADAFVVLLEPLADGVIGEAIISGVCQVQIDVASAADTTCGADVDDTAKLKSGAGSNSILWKESGTGTKWAVVRIGGGGGNILKLAKLNAALSAGSSCQASVWEGDPLADSGDDLTVNDWLLGTGESLDSGTKVVILLVSGNWYVIQASCSAS